MTLRLKDFVVNSLFEVHSGDFHATKELDPGATPLVSCGDTNNGVVGYFDIPEDYIYKNAITVAYNGSWPLMSKFHPYGFGAKDDVAVLMPRAPIQRETLIYVAVLLNRLTWRYSYGRKCFRQKLENVTIPLPVAGSRGVEAIDESLIRELHRQALTSVLTRMATNMEQWREVSGEKGAGSARSRPGSS